MALFVLVSFLLATIARNADVVNTVPGFDIDPYAFTQPLYAYRDVYYAANFSIGSPGQPVTLAAMILGDGVSVPSKGRLVDGFCDHFDPAKSTTFPSDPLRWGGELGDSGVRGQDVVSLFDGKTKLFNVTAHVFAITNVSKGELFARNAFDGFFGINSLLKTAPVAEQKATVVLSRTCAEGFTGEAGWITYGISDPKCELTGSTAMTLTNTAASVSVTAANNGQNTASAGWNAVLDITAEDIIVPKAAFDKLSFGATRATNGKYGIDCSATVQLSFNFTAMTTALSSNELIYKANSGFCYLRVVPRPDTTDNTVVLGLPFLRQFCQVYDFQKERVSFGAYKMPAATKRCEYKTERPEIVQRQCDPTPTGGNANAVEAKWMSITVSAIICLLINAHI